MYMYILYMCILYVYSISYYVSIRFHGSSRDPAHDASLSVEVHIDSYM